MSNMHNIEVAIITTCAHIIIIASLSVFSSVFICSFSNFRVSIAKFWKRYSLLLHVFLFKKHTYLQTNLIVIQWNISVIFLGIYEWSIHHLLHAYCILFLLLAKNDVNSQCGGYFAGKIPLFSVFFPENEKIPSFLATRTYS